MSYIIFPNRLSCVRNISIVIVLYFLKTAGTEGIGTKFMKHFISQKHGIEPRVSNSNPYSGYMEAINGITEGNGEKLWPKWRVNEF